MSRNDIFRIRARDRLIGEKLASQGIPEKSKGKPLSIPQFNFTISLEKKVQSMFGTPKYAARARRIENITQQLMEDLSCEYEHMTNQYGENPEIFAQKWKELIDSLELDEINQLIDKHNKYYPVEANLQIDPDTGAPLLGSSPWKPTEKITQAELLTLFPLHIRAR